MRYGVIAMQVNTLIPSGFSSEELLAHVVNFDHGNLINQIADKGFNIIELGGDLAMFLPQTFEPQAIERLIALKEARDLTYTVHLPLWSVEPSTPLMPVRKGSVNAVVNTIRTTLPLEPEVFVIHATGALAAEFCRLQISEVARGILLKQFQSGARESLMSILSETGIPSRQLAIETVEFPLELTLELADELNLSMCLDTGHVLVGFSGPVKIFDALEMCLPRLGEVHLHDGPWQGPDMNIGYGKDHQPLGDGDLDVGRLIDRLEEANFNGPVVFELSADQALDSLNLIRSIRPRAVF